MVCIAYVCIFVFFCCKQKTAYEGRISDWSSDVCSSDLAEVAQYYALDEGVSLTGAIAGKASIWAEELTPTAPDVRTIATYRDPGGWLDGKAEIGRAWCRERVCQYV